MRECDGGWGEKEAVAHTPKKYSLIVVWGFNGWVGADVKRKDVTF